MAVKETDSVADIQRLHASLKIFIVIYFLSLGGFVYWTLYGGGRDYPLGDLFRIFFLILLLSILASWASGRIVHALAARAGSHLANVVLGIRSCRTVREQLAGDLERVKFFCREKAWKSALDVIDGVLEKDAECPEALALKAKILGDGLGDQEGTRAVLRQLLHAAPKEDPHRRWAMEYYVELATNPAGDEAGPDAEMKS